MNSPSRSFLAPEIFEDAMVVDEIDFGHAEQNPATPFKGSRFSVYPNAKSPLDIHDVKECWFIASGSGVLTVNGDSVQPVKPGDVLLFDPQQSHEVYNDGKENLVVFSVWW